MYTILHGPTNFYLKKHSIKRVEPAWIPQDKLTNSTLFKNEHGAMMSLRHILKDVPELKEEALYMVEVDDNNNIKKLYQIYNMD